MQGLLWSAYAAGEVELPESQAQLLAARDLAVQAHHARLWRVLHEVQARLTGLGLETAAFKGVTAEARWYGRLGERPCWDIDLLLAPGSEGRLAEVLEELEPGHPLRAETARLFRSGALQSVDLTVKGVAIDLHADLFKVEIPTRGADVLWSRMQFMEGHEGAQVRVPAPEISLILFAIHLNKDRFARLLGYADVARIVAREPLDWGLIDAFLEREGLRVHVYSTLLAVAATLRTPAPPVPRLRGWRRQAWARLWPRSTRLRGYVGLGTQQHRQLWIPWLAEGRTLEALRWWLRRRLLPPGSLLRVYDPDISGPYAVRWVAGRYRAWRKRREEARIARRAASNLRVGSAGR